VSLADGKRERYLYTDPGVLGPRYAGFAEPPASINEDDFEIIGPVATSIVDYFDVSAGPLAEILSNIKDRFDIYQSPPGFNDTFEIYLAPGAKALFDQETAGDSVVFDSRIVKPIGKTTV
jgi:hypothetical protein